MEFHIWSIIWFTIGWEVLEEVHLSVSVFVIWWWGDWHNYIIIRRLAQFRCKKERGRSKKVRQEDPVWESSSATLQIMRKVLSSHFLSFPNFLKLFWAVFNIWYYRQSMEGFSFSKSLEYFNRYLYIALAFHVLRWHILESFCTIYKTPFRSYICSGDTILLLCTFKPERRKDTFPFCKWLQEQTGNHFHVKGILLQPF